MNEIYYKEDFDRLLEGIGRGDYTKDDFLADFGLRIPAVDASRLVRNSDPTCSCMSPATSLPAAS